MPKPELHEVIDRLGNEGAAAVIDRVNGNWVIRAEMADDSKIEVSDMSFTLALRMLNAALEVFNA